MKLRIPHGWLLIGPYIFLTLGLISNAFVMAANGAQMPVLAPGGCDAFAKMNDPQDVFHVCMTHATHLKILADWIVYGGGIMSLGDIGINAWILTATPAMIVWVAWIIRDYTKALEK